VFTKLLLIGALGTGAVGTGAATGYAPSSIEFAAGPVRVEAGNGKILSAHMAAHTPFTLTVKLQSDRKLQVKF